MQVYELNGKRPQIHESARILPGAVIAGDVRIAEDVLIGFGAVVYAESATLEINRGACIADGAVVHCLGEAISVGQFALVSHGGQVCGGFVEDYAWVGINSVVLPSARVATESMLAADSMLLPGTATEPRTLWAGRPASQQEERSEEELAIFRERAVKRFTVFDTLKKVDPTAVRCG